MMAVLLFCLPDNEMSLAPILIFRTTTQLIFLSFASL